MVRDSNITSGQLSIRWIERNLNDYLNKLLETDKEDYVIVTSDTDSVYITFDRLVSKVFKEGAKLTKIISFMDTIVNGDKIEPFIDKSYQDLIFICNVTYEQKIIKWFVRLEHR